MHYAKLIRAHELFYDSEPRARFYDEYLQDKNQQDWDSGNVSLTEIERLFRFVREWEYHFHGDPAVFKRIYDGNFPAVKLLMAERIEDADFDNSSLRMRIRYIFDRVADCARIRRYESTDASTILHTILPRLFVIWGNVIKDSVRVYSRGANYSGIFLPKMQRELMEAIKTCVREKRINRSDAVAFIENQCENKTLAKLADEYNYMKYARKNPEVI
jgi:hypothetical protein